LEEDCGGFTEDFNSKKRGEKQMAFLVDFNKDVPGNLTFGKKKFTDCIQTKYPWGCGGDEGDHSSEHVKDFKSPLLGGRKKKSKRGISALC